MDAPSLVDDKRPVVASYCGVFLKPEMLHIYRQVTGLRRYETFVLAKERQCQERYPFGDVNLVDGESSMPLFKRLYLKYIRMVPPLIYRGEMGMMEALLKTRHADLMHIYFGHIGVHLLPFIERWDRPCIVSFHGADVMLRERRPAYAKQMRRMLQLVPLVLARSHSLADRLKEIGCPPAKIRINRTGIPLGDFPYLRREAPKNGEWHFVQTCRLIPKKGLITALKAFAKFYAANPQAKFTIAGDGPMLKDLQALVTTLGIQGAVVFPGFMKQAELFQIYAGAHLFLHPSEMTEDKNQEGIPNSMLEAMSTGLPVVATWHGGIPEAVLHGQSGFLVPEHAPEALAEALFDMTASWDSLAEMGLKASESVRAEFEQSKSIAKLESFYDEAVKLGACRA
jgi:colanic acid/amylovoran biosynthesis glycosyltransferase